MIVESYDILYIMSLDNSHLNVYTQCSLFTSYVCTVVTHNSYVCTVVTMKGRASVALGNLLPTSVFYLGNCSILIINTKWYLLSISLCIMQQN